MSHPSWVCGLKLCVVGLDGCQFWSHPSWVCGLKQLAVSVPNLQPIEVTPFVGVWIETFWAMPKRKPSAESHPSWVCGLKRF